MQILTTRSLLPPGNDAQPDFDGLFAAEDRHFWFRARNKVLAGIVTQLVADLPIGYGVLEVGCGTGNVLRVLEQVCTNGKVMGVELHEEGLRYARQRVRCPLVAADIHEASFPEPFHLVGLFDVLEHLPDDLHILKALRDNLRPGGRLLLTVPAYQSLWSYADEYAGHYRRYAPQQLRAVLQEAGFRIEYLTQFMMLLYPFMKLGRWWNSGGNKRSPEDRKERIQRELDISSVANATLYSLLSWEAGWIGRRLRLPLGTSLLAVAVPIEASQVRLPIA